MRLAPIKAEQRLHVIVLQQDVDAPERRRLRNYILSETRVDDFGSEEGAEIRKRMDVLIKNGRDLGDVEMFLEDPTLSAEAREFLNVSEKFRRKASTVPLGKAKRLVALLHDYRKSRALYSVAQEITQLCTGSLAEDTFAKAEEALLRGVKAIREDRTKKLTHAGRLRSTKDARKWFKRFMKPRKDRFVSTGLPALDRHMKGFQRGDMVVISAPRGGGKTALLLQAAINQFRAGFNVGIASLEMREEHLWERVVANVCETKFWKVRSRDVGGIEGSRWMWRKWLRFEIDTKRKYNNFFTPWDIKDPDYMPENIELDLGPFGYDVIYVDYISLFGTGNKDMWRAQKDHGRHLKALAARLNCVIVVLTQLSKDERVKYGTGPEEDADYWIWWRYGDDEVSSNNVELRMDKARHAKRCVIDAKFNLAKMSIVTKGTKDPPKPEAPPARKSGKGAKVAEDEDEPVSTLPDPSTWDVEFEDPPDIDLVQDEPEQEDQALEEPRPRVKSRKGRTAAEVAAEIDKELDD